MKIKKIIEHFKKNKLNFISIVIFIVISFFLNKFPNDYVVVQGDFNQKTYHLDTLTNYKYIWSNEVGLGNFNMLHVAYPFFFILKYISDLGLNESFINSFILFIFLSGSYFSFKKGVEVFEVKISEEDSFLFSLIYSLNYFTFWVFSYGWGMQPHFYIYMFLPLIFSYFFKALIDFNYKNISIFTLINIISLISYSNISFLIVLIIVEAIFIITYLLLYKNKQNFYKISILFFVQCLILVPLVLINLIGLKNDLYTQTQEWFPSEYFFKSTSNQFIDLFFNASSSATTIPTSDEKILNYSIFLTKYSQIILFIFIFYYLVNKKNLDKFYKLFFIIFLSIFIINLRYKPPFEELNLILFKLTFEVFRSPDKFQPFYSFFLILLGLLSYIQIPNNKLKKILLLGFIFFSSSFFIFGGASKIMQISNNSKGNIYRTLVKVPKEYFFIENKFFKNNPTTTTILNLPYSADNSPGWSNYPKWNLLGSDITKNIYSKNSVTSNLGFNYASKKNEFKEFEYKKKNKEELIKLFQQTSTEYIIFHKDITQEWIGKTKHTEKALLQLENDKYLNKLETNDYFDLYQIEKKFIQPLFISSKTNLKFKKINPTKYILNIENLNESTMITFNQIFFNNWKIYLLNKDFTNNNNPITYNFENNRIEEYKTQEEYLNFEDLKLISVKPAFDERHKIVNNYANSWIISKKEIINNFPSSYYNINDDGTLNITISVIFLPQLFFNLYLLMISIIFIISICYLFYIYLFKKFR